MSHFKDRPDYLNRYACVGLTNPKNAFNVGAALRACGCFGTKMLVASGNRFMDKGDYRNMDTDRTHLKIPFIHSVSDIKSFIPEHCTPVSVEFVKDSIPLPNYTHPERAFYIFGPEDGMVDNETTSYCKDKIFIPMTYGCNLGAAVYIVLYDRMSKEYNIKDETPHCPNCNSTHYIEDLGLVRCQGCSTDYNNGLTDWIKKNEP